MTSARRCRREARHRRCCIHADDPRQRVAAANDASTLTRSRSRGAIAVAAPARPRDQVARRSPRTTAATAATLGGASTRHRHPQRDRHRSIVMADRCRWPLPRGRHRSHALVSSRHARRHDCGPIRNQEEGAGWSTRRCAISVSGTSWRRVHRALLGVRCRREPCCRAERWRRTPTSVTTTPNPTSTTG